MDVSICHYSSGGGGSGGVGGDKIEMLCTVCMSVSGRGELCVVQRHKINILERAKHLI